METNENYQVTQGAALMIDVTLRNAEGSPITTYDGSQSLTTTIWPGGSRAPACTATTMWTSVEQGAITIVIADTQTAALAPGRYQLLCRLSDAGTPVDAYGCTLDVLAAPGTSAAPATYGGYSDLLRYGRSWLRQFQTDDDEAGFAEQLGRARTWIEDLGHAHYRIASMTMVVDGQAFGPSRSGARSGWLQEQFEADALMVTDQVREAAAKKALAYICEGQVGLGEQAGQYARLARMYHAQADYIATCMTLGLDTNGDGHADVVIDCSCTDPMES